MIGNDFINIIDCLVFDSCIHQNHTYAIALMRVIFICDRLLHENDILESRLKWEKGKIRINIVVGMRMRYAIKCVAHKCSTISEHLDAIASKNIKWSPSEGLIP